MQIFIGDSSKTESRPCRIPLRASEKLEGKASLQQSFHRILYNTNFHRRDKSQKYERTDDKHFSCETKLIHHKNFVIARIKTGWSVNNVNSSSIICSYSCFQISSCQRWRDKIPLRLFGETILWYQTLLKC